MRTKAVICLSLLAVVGVVSASAGEWKVGANAGYTLGGDIEESSFAPGVQAAYVFEDEKSNSSFFLELAGSKFSDGLTESDMGIVIDIDMDVTAWTLVAGIGSSQKNKVRFNLVGGVGYYTTDADIAVDASGMGATLGAPGLTVSGDFDTEIKDSVGWILGAGLEFVLAKHLEMFIDYRYSFLTMHATLTGTATASYQGRSATETVSEDVKGDYNHGIARVGLNFVF